MQLLQSVFHLIALASKFFRNSGPITETPVVMTKHQEIEKLGAGLFFVTDGPDPFVLLLKRKSSHNDKTWDMPGGNSDSLDNKDYLGIAEREATEETGHLPNRFDVRDSILVTRGKNDQKHYHVFVARLSKDSAYNYKPELEPSEHSDWHWFNLRGLFQLQDHQKSNGLPPLSKIDDFSNKHVGAENGQTYIEQGVQLHPVVFKLVDKKNRDKILHA